MITCENLSIGYNGNVIHDNISFSVTEGDYVCVMGNNGTGKTTLVKTMVGLIAPIHGSVRLKSGIKVGYLPQQGIVQKNFPTSAYEVILSGNQGRTGLFYKLKDYQRADNICKKLGIQGLKNKNYSELSGGQQQKVLLARALCASEKLLILDEPITGLDITAQKNFYRILRTYNKDGTTIIMISHDKDAINEDATHVLKVDDNQVCLMSKGDYLMQWRQMNV